MTAYVAVLIGPNLREPFTSLKAAHIAATILGPQYAAHKLQEPS